MNSSCYGRSYIYNAKHLYLILQLLMKVFKKHYLSGGGVSELKVGMRAVAGTDALASPKVRVAVTSSGILHETLLYFD